jgi:hypothetical protein
LAPTEGADEKLVTDRIARLSHCVDHGVAVRDALSMTKG